MICLAEITWQANTRFEMCKVICSKSSALLQISIFSESTCNQGFV